MTLISNCLPFLSSCIQAVMFNWLVTERCRNDISTSLKNSPHHRPVVSAPEKHAPEPLAIESPVLGGPSNSCESWDLTPKSMDGVYPTGTEGEIHEQGFESTVTEEFSNEMISGRRDSIYWPASANESDCLALEDSFLSMTLHEGSSRASLVGSPRCHPAGGLVLAINSGGQSLSTSVGLEFLEDQLYAGGSVLRTHEVICGTHEPSLYQTARYGDVLYSIDALHSQAYIVDLHFAEIVFTNGPAGMRVFDVYIQGEKVISEIDVYAEVGSNKALISSVRTSVAEDGILCIELKGVVGTPTISALCIHRAPLFESEKFEMLRDTATNDGCDSLSPKQFDSVHPLGKAPGTGDTYSLVTYKLKSQQLASTMKLASKPPICGQDCRDKVKELTNECHEAWISLQDANSTIEKLQNELVSKSCTVDTLASAVESQDTELREVREKTDGEMLRWKIALVNLVTEVEGIKNQYGGFARDTKDWIRSFPDVTGMIVAVRSLVTEHDDLKKKYGEESQARKQLYNKVLELKGNIRVFCRCRPLNSSEAANSASAVVEFGPDKDNELVVRSGNSKKNFKFDRVFMPENDQVEVFGSTAPVVVSVLDGYNVCIFAYGQTGTGKTFTMEGCPGNRGVNYRTLEELFNVADRRKDEVQYEISVSALEVYNEQIRDLLAPTQQPYQTTKKLEVKHGVDGGQHVPGLVEATVHSMPEVWDVLQLGSSARAVGSTNANEHSSRSHCMLCVMVKGNNLLTGESTRSKLWLVDLAGSERVAKTDVQGERLKETQSINKSLSSLGDVIYSLTTKSSHIPYRNSKLTHILQDSLGGDSKTIMFVQISPSEDDIGETICSLNFASRVRGVELGPARKQVDTTELFKYKQLAERAKLESKSKEDSMKKLEENFRAVEIKLKVKEHMYQTLFDKMKEKEKTLADLEVQLLAEKRLRIQPDVSKGVPVDKQCMEKQSMKLERRPLFDKALENSDGHIKMSSCREIPEKRKLQHNENTDPQQNDTCGPPQKTSRVKVVPSRYNSPTPAKKIHRRPMRASIASTYVIKPSSLDASFSFEGGNDTFQDNSRQITNPFLNPGTVGLGEPVGPLLSIGITWKKGHGAPSAVHRVGPSGPGRRSVRFASPVLDERTDEMLGKEKEDSIICTDNFPLPLDRRTSGILEMKKQLGVAKLRRLSIARPFGRFPANGAGAQRVLKGVVDRGDSLKSAISCNVQQQQRERRWNK